MLKVFKNISSFYGNGQNSGNGAVSMPGQEVALFVFLTRWTQILVDDGSVCDARRQRFQKVVLSLTSMGTEHLQKAATSCLCRYFSKDVFCVPHLEHRRRQKDWNRSFQQVALDEHSAGSWSCPRSKSLIPAVNLKWNVKKWFRLHMFLWCQNKIRFKNQKAKALIF